MRRGFTSGNNSAGLFEKYVNSAFDSLDFIRENLSEIVSVSHTLDLVSGILFYRYTATASQTIFTGSDESGRSMTIPGDNPLVYVNQELQDPSTYVVENTNTQVRFLTGLPLGSKVLVSAFAFNLDGSIYYDEILSQDNVLDLISSLSSSKWAYSAAAPIPSFGNVGDFVLKADGAVYEKTAVDTWVNRMNITGPQGAQGNAFAPDAIGDTAGRAAHNAEPKDYAYLDIQLGEIFFKLSNTSGDWSVGVPFGEGPPGADGADGAPGSQWHYLTNPPGSGFGVVGDFVLVDNGDVYEKTGPTTWTLRQSLKGPAGLDGADGAQGIPGPTGPVGPDGPVIVASQAEAEGGTENTKAITALRTAQYVSFRLATQAEAQAGSNNVKLMTPLRAMDQLTAKGMGMGGVVSYGGRTHSTVYQNTSGRPMLIFARVGNSNGSPVPMHISSNNVSYITTGDTAVGLTLIVPPGWYYKMLHPGGTTTIYQWVEHK